MNVFTLALVAAFFGLSAILCMVLLHIRRRRERLQMKRHMQAIERVGWTEVARRT